MLIGNPDKFAFLLEIVPEWCFDNFIQGILNVYINGVQYPDTLRTTTLSSDLHWLLEDASPFINPQINEELYSLEKVELFNTLSKVTFSETGENDYSYLIPLHEISDAGFYLFIVASEKEVRLLITHCSKFNVLTFSDEVKIDILDFECIKQKVTNYYMNEIQR